MTTTVVTPKFARIALKMAHHAPALLPFLPMFRVAAEAAGLEYADYQERPKLRYHGRVIITAWERAGRPVLALQGARPLEKVKKPQR